MDRGDGADPASNVTYHFTSTTPRPRPRTRNTHVLSMHTTVDEYPTSTRARRALVRTHGPRLVQEWIDRGLPAGELYHLVHRPGELEPSEAARVHRADQADALAREYGGVPIVMSLANAPVDPALVVSRVRFD